MVFSRTPMPKPMQLFLRSFSLILTLEHKMVDFGIQQFLFGQTAQICFTAHCCCDQWYCYLSDSSNLAKSIRNLRKHGVALQGLRLMFWQCREKYFTM